MSIKRTAQAVVILGLALLPVGPGAALAQGASGQPASAQGTEVREVYPRDLMTISERFDMWRKMRSARTPEEKVELWATKRAELETRAAERGVRLRDMGPMMMNGHSGSRDRDSNWGGDGRMGRAMTPGGGMHPPPAGR